MDKPESLTEWEQFLAAYSPSPEYGDDRNALHVCRLALEAAQQGTFGVGAVLLNEQQSILVEGHNTVFLNGFRSDLHAEMVIMNEFERRHSRSESIRNCTLVTSLEPCPMCMTRLIMASVGTVVYISKDAEGGMVHRMQCLPPLFQQFSKGQGQQWRHAECSDQMREAALSIWALTRYLENRIADAGIGHTKQP